MPNDGSVSALSTERSFVPLLDLLLFYRSRRILLIWSLFIFLIFFVILLLVLSFFTNFVFSQIQFVIPAPAEEDSPLWHLLFWFLNGMFVVCLRAASFFLSFLPAYTLASPFLQFLSISADTLYRGKKLKEDAFPDIDEVFGDLKDGAVTALLCFGLTVIAIIADFIPFLGALICAALLLSVSAFLVIRFPSSRRGWDLRQTIEWVIGHPWDSARLGMFLPLIAAVPILSPFLVATIFPFLVLYGALNLDIIEEVRRKKNSVAHTKIVDEGS